jgi:hypothetical protein
MRTLSLSFGYQSFAPERESWVRKRFFSKIPAVKGPEPLPNETCLSSSRSLREFQARDASGAVRVGRGVSAAQ